MHSRIEDALASSSRLCTNQANTILCRECDYIYAIRNLRMQSVARVPCGREPDNYILANVFARSAPPLLR